MKLAIMMDGRRIAGVAGAMRKGMEPFDCTVAMARRMGYRVIFVDISYVGVKTWLKRLISR